MLCLQYSIKFQSLPHFSESQNGQFLYRDSPLSGTKFCISCSDDVDSVLCYCDKMWWPKATIEERVCLWFMVPGRESINGGESRQQAAKTGNLKDHIVIRQEVKRQGTRKKGEAIPHAHNDMLPLARLHSLKVPWPPSAVPSTGDQVFRHIHWWGAFLL